MRIQTPTEEELEAAARSIGTTPEMVLEGAYRQAAVYEALMRLTAHIAKTSNTPLGTDPKMIAKRVVFTLMVEAHSPTQGQQAYEVAEAYLNGTLDD